MLIWSANIILRDDARVRGGIALHMVRRREDRAVTSDRSYTWPPALYSVQSYCAMEDLRMPGWKMDTTST